MFTFDAPLSTTIRIDAPNTRRSEGGRLSRPLAREQMGRMQRYWMAANYLCVGQIYLRDNPLLARPLTPEDIKPRLLGHWGT
ncbi:MAG TPA: hypothetical protein VKT72_02260, partial [Candidatus Baltobacteraceae bacterium]|nr:hypothetical protein [Candidatus Baltobacteraceae bacterium]